MRDLLLALRSRFNTPVESDLLETSSKHAEILESLQGGYEWSCGGEEAAEAYLTTDDVMKALHIANPGQSGFSYDTSGPASITLYPELAKHIRVFIYNGDSDSCVPYKGNEEWITSLVSNGVLQEKEAWTPWYTSQWPDMPAGYVTTYDVLGEDGKVDANAPDFTFLTIRLAGHMVPTFQPQASLNFFERILKGPWK